MWRLAVLIIFATTLVGALMPSFEPAPPSVDSQRTIRVDTFEESLPSPPTEDLQSGSVTLQRNFDGHFYADAQVNGATVHFLVDTGASGIALTTEDARRAGLAFDSGRAEVIGSGASGAVLGHWVELNRVQLGLKSVSSTPAVVLEDGDRSLLGQSFLSKFGAVEIHGDTMVLR
jgi:aspartyl protease family protein